MAPTPPNTRGPPSMPRSSPMTRKKSDTVSLLRERMPIALRPLKNRLASVSPRCNCSVCAARFRGSFQSGLLLAPGSPLERITEDDDMVTATDLDWPAARQGERTPAADAALFALIDELRRCEKR